MQGTVAPGAPGDGYGETDKPLPTVTIHPQGPDTDKLELRWQVNPMVVSILHSEAKIHRVYSYTLSLELCDKGKPTGTFVYLDPQIVDTGGGNK